MLIALALFYSAPAVTEQSWTGFQGWMIGQPCSTQTDIEEGTCTMPEITFKNKRRSK
jgi:hypothetical protein